MRRIVFFGLSVFLGSCSYFGQSGELIPVESPRFQEKQPMGMVLVKRGSFLMGSDVDSLATWGTINKEMQVSVENFWMDQTEVTNKMYKEFVKAVIDSISRDELGEEFLVRNSKGEFKKALDKQQRAEFYEKMYRTNPSYPSLKIIKSEYLNYRYRWFDEIAANQSGNQLNPARRIYNTDLKVKNTHIYYEKDSNYLNEEKNMIMTKKMVVRVNSIDDYVQTKIVNIYPDTTVWVNDFKNSNSIDYTRNYFSSGAYNNYPIVGVTWEQANAFSVWRTNLYYLSGNVKRGMISPFRLPTETEWEYAARSIDDTGRYPWKNDTVTYQKKSDDKYLFFGNFKPGVGNFSEDGFIIMSPVGVYKPNSRGIYDLGGNAAEWTCTAYFEFGNTVEPSINPGMEFNALNSDPYLLKRKVVRGGSYKDAKEFISSKIRAYEYQNVPRAYIGFRNVRRKIGE